MCIPKQEALKLGAEFLIRPVVAADRRSVRLELQADYLAGVWAHYGQEQFQFAAGDAIFVPAGVDHRFLNFSGDLAVWVMFAQPPAGCTKT